MADHINAILFIVVTVDKKKDKITSLQNNMGQIGPDI